MVWHRPFGSGTDVPWQHRSADNVDPEPPDGCGAGLARHPSRPLGRPALRRPDDPSKLGVSIGRNREAWPVDSGRHGVFGGGGCCRRLGHPIVCCAIRVGAGAFGAGLCGDRAGRGGVGHIVAGAFGHHNRTQTARGGSHYHLVDDDRWHCGHSRRGWRTARALYSATVAWDRRRGGPRGHHPDLACNFPDRAGLGSGSSRRAKPGGVRRCAA